MQRLQTRGMAAGAVRGLLALALLALAAPALAEEGHEMDTDAGAADQLRFDLEDRDADQWAGYEDGAAEHDDGASARSEVDRRDLKERFVAAMDEADTDGDGKVGLEAFAVANEGAGTAEAEAMALLLAVARSYEEEFGDLGVTPEEVGYVLEEIAETAAGGAAVPRTAAEMADLYLLYEDETGSHFFPMSVDMDMEVRRGHTEAEIDAIMAKGVTPEDDELSAQLRAEHEKAQFGAQHFPYTDMASAPLVCSRCVVAADEVRHAFYLAHAGGYVSDGPGGAVMRAEDETELARLLADVCENAVRHYDVTVFYEDEGGKRVVGYAATPNGWTDEPSPSQRLVMNECRALVATHRAYLTQAGFRNPAPPVSEVSRRLCVPGACTEQDFAEFSTGGVLTHDLDVEIRDSDEGEKAAAGLDAEADIHFVGSGEFAEGTDGDGEDQAGAEADLDEGYELDHEYVDGDGGAEDFEGADADADGADEHADDAEPEVEYMPDDVVYTTQHDEL